MKTGTKVKVSGYTDELWIEDYHVKVNSIGILQETPSTQAKKVLVCIDEIDGDKNVNILIRKSKLICI